MIYLYLFGTCFHFIYVFMIIENNVSVCTGAIVIGNVHIGDHTIIGAGSIVVHSTPPDSIVTGIAAKAKTHSKN